MGRRDAVQVTLEVIARMRHILPSLVVSYEPGWETRGNGTSANYEGGLVHHTASTSSLARPFPSQTVLRQGRSDLPGPLCNMAGPACTVDAPRLHVMSANPANHAGASGGRSMGPLPTTGLFNPRVMGLEIDYAGSVPMLAGQLLVGHVWARAVADVVGGGDIERVRAHYETSVTGKWDIGAGAGSVDMAAFRRAAASISSTNHQEDDMAQRDIDEINRKLSLLLGVETSTPDPREMQIPTQVWRAPMRNGNPEGPGRQTFEEFAVDTQANAFAAARLGLQLAARPAADLDEQEVAAALAPLMGQLLPQVIGRLSDGDVKRLAMAAADESDARERARLAQSAG